MFGKLLTVTAGVAGYVLGSRAGRERYEQIKDQALKVRGNPKVQKAASNTQDLAADKAASAKHAMSHSDESPQDEPETDDRFATDRPDDVNFVTPASTNPEFPRHG